MPSPLYSLSITAVGEYVTNYLAENKLILFAEPAPADIAMYCALHRASDL